jgi:hypothetical protein
MSWAQLTNRPNNVSHRYNNNNNHNNTTYYRKSTNNNNNNRKTINNQYNTTQLSTTKVQTTSSKRKHSGISYVILDSGAFIGRQSFFNNFSQNPFTQYSSIPTGAKPLACTYWDLTFDNPQI